MKQKKEIYKGITYSITTSIKFKEIGIKDRATFILITLLLPDKKNNILLLKNMNLKIIMINKKNTLFKWKKKL